jgi:hypothetical protein
MSVKIILKQNASLVKSTLCQKEKAKFLKYSNNHNIYSWTSGSMGSVFTDSKQIQMENIEKKDWV